MVSLNFFLLLFPVFRLKNLVCEAGEVEKMAIENLGCQCQIKISAHMFFFFPIYNPSTEIGIKKC